MQKSLVALTADSRSVGAFTHKDTNLITGACPLFALRLRGRDGATLCLSAADAATVETTAEGAVYGGFATPEGESLPLRVRVTLSPLPDGAEWGLEVENATPLAVEWVDYPCLPLGKLKKEGGDGELLLSYNEGVLIDEARARDLPFPSKSPEYPSEGAYYMFPHMLSAQFIARIGEGGGVYLGAHDPARGPKALDYRATEEGVTLFVKTFTGCDYGEDYRQAFPMVSRAVEGGWEDAAALYRAWFEAHLPAGTVKSADNPRLPEWYAESPLMVAYPVRGIHDMDEMNPNALFPYSRALPLMEEIAEATGTRVMALLMHWEGTAPWAPPYVWPPYGGEESFRAFMDALHEKGHLLGVYCSGFGWTLKSNLIEDYDNTAEAPAVLDAMCAAPDGEVHLSHICTAQRSGYDICAASPHGREILLEAYAPLLRSGVDYAQILDQNHGGAQYFCYSPHHGHPPMPGSWMTTHMQSLLGEWNRLSPRMLLGCESAAAEPFTPNLLFSDNRFELNYFFGRPVPLYAFLFHEYLRNFMGNQVSCPFSVEDGTLCMRMAYSFTAGDALTLTLMPDGELMPNWGCRDFSHLPDKATHLGFIRRLMDFYRAEAGVYLGTGRMIKPLPVTCPTVAFTTLYGYSLTLPALFSTAWEAEGRQVQIFVNHTDTPVTATWRGEELTVPALDAVMREL